MPGPITVEWINEKIGALYITGVQLQEEVQRLYKENAELKAKLEKPAEADNKQE